MTGVVVGALLLGLSIGVAVLAPALGGAPIVIGGFFWDILTALGTVAAAGAAAYAARKAVSIDEKVAERSRDRERRDAIPLAFALRFELRHAAALMATSAQMLTGPLDPAGLLRGARETANLFDTPILRMSATKLGCFDLQTGQALGEALAAAEHFTRLLRFPEMDVPNPDFDRLVAEVLDKNARSHSALISAAVERLDFFLAG